MAFFSFQHSSICTDHNIEIIVALQSALPLKESCLLRDISNSWNHLIKLSFSDSDSSKHTATLCISMAKKQQYNIVDTASAMLLCDSLGQSIIHFGKQLLTHLIKPVLHGATVKINTKDLSGEYTIVVKKVDGEVKLVDKFNSISKIFDFLNACDFNSQLSTDGDVNLMSELRNVIASETLEFIISECLVHTIPSSQEELQQYESSEHNITITEELQKKLMQYGFLEADDTTLTDYVSNIKSLFINKQCQQILVQAQELMMSDMHNMVSVEVSRPDDHLEPLLKKKVANSSNKGSSHERLGDETFFMPQCSIR